MPEAAQPAGEIVLYQTEDGTARIECRFAEENVWLSQALLAELFQTTPQNITLHLKAIYQEGELREEATCKDYLQVQVEGTPGPAPASPEEITELNRIVTMFLDFAEDQAKRRKQVFLKEWRERLDSFLQFNERRVLPDAGRVSREEANRHAETEYERFAERRRGLAEAEGMKQLEDAAKKLAEQKRKPPGRKRK